MRPYASALSQVVRVTLRVTNPCSRSAIGLKTTSDLQSGRRESNPRS
ncbi:hypothetical protein PBI_MELVIN_34 [Mycobacterium phage Melvin]|nr:hypothetical protein PBI_MELVIN_34 [Mycobacterium phage Melvin]